MQDKPEIYFKNDIKWRKWLHVNHKKSDGIHLILYKVGHEMESMRWEEAVRVALCYGWIDSTVKSLGGGKRRQYFCPRKPKSVWSKVNKTHIENLIKDKLMHQSGLESIAIAKENGSWTALDTVENGEIPEDLQVAFNENTEAFKNFKAFAFGYQKSYLYWLYQAKRAETRQKRVHEIVLLCEKNMKTRGNW